MLQFTFKIPENMLIDLAEKNSPSSGALIPLQEQHLLNLSVVFASLDINLQSISNILKERFQPFVFLTLSNHPHLSLTPNWEITELIW